MARKNCVVVGIYFKGGGYFSDYLIGGCYHLIKGFCICMCIECSSNDYITHSFSGMTYGQYIPDRDRAS